MVISLLELGRSRVAGLGPAAHRFLPAERLKALKLRDNSDPITPLCDGGAVVAGTELKTYRYDSSRQGIDGQWRDAAAAVNYFSQIAGHYA
jgi:hypothetical protein